MSPAWSQSYTLFGRGLAFSAITASLPIVTLLFLLGIRRKPAWIAALSALVVALVIASAKALLVVLFFMHVKYTSEKMTKVVFVAAIFWLLILLTLSLADYTTRLWS